ncbi:hypothetical protein EC973_004094 [Apophysomyces ossiformis]|uniref:cAMP-dependent protein kinase regulatory subunit n=1 Tax=Apophysomyces ossiformis TaxID=679940 RepID=A0A8H7ELZ1_9FUNG|nr:hypothetical protein EC973_004094 [Apophysomyces ossiformis]
MVTLQFTETHLHSGLLKVSHHEENWTVEGLIQTIPIVRYWYDHVLRTVMGKALSTTGEVIYTAAATAEVLVSRNQEIENARKQLAHENAKRLKDKASRESFTDPCAKLHPIKRKVKHRVSASQSISLLPTFSAEDTETEEELHEDVRPIEQDQWHIKLFHVRYTTQRCNQLFNKMTKAAPRFWQIWFTLGALAAVFIMVAGVIVISMAALKILASIRHILNPPISHQRVKRSMDEEDDQVFLPMIPGVTLPMSHLGYYLMALLICGVFHEAGHAIASFSERVPIQSSGVFMYYLYPGAFVNIPDQQLQMLSPFKQLKIVCAGVWHNLILYLITMMFLSGGLQAVLLLCGWQSLQASGGVSVVNVRDGSPLAVHLPTSTVIYQLDDVRLENNLIDWNAFLLDQHGRNRASQGFCAAIPQEEAASSDNLDCCRINEDHPFGQSENASISCFEDFASMHTGKNPELLSCLATLEVLATPDAKRCTLDSECGTMRCVTPYTPAIEGQMVRIYATLPPWQGVDNERDKVFLFEGELIDIWESVKVSILRPRFWILPASIPHICELVLRYTSSFTLALALLNILPAFKLDGEYALGQLLALLLHSNQGPVTTRAVETQRYTRRLRAIIVKVASTVVGPQPLVSEEYQLLLNELNRQVYQRQPDDILQFCANFFMSKLEEERMLVRKRPSFDHPLQPGKLQHNIFCVILSKKKGKAAGGIGMAFPQEGVHFGHGEEEQEDVGQEEDDEAAEARDTVSDDMPSLLSVPSHRGRRTSVSAESIQPSHTEYVKKVIPKSEQQCERIRAAIENNFLFKNLDEEQYQDVVHAMEEKRVPNNTRVIEQGDVGDYFYIVESGTLDCFVGDQKVTEYCSGGSFGELALMYNAPRAATIVTTSEAVLWALDRVTFRSILMENTARKRRMYEQFLEEVPILKPLDTYGRHKIADALESVQFEDQEVVIREGDVGENFYLIESGNVVFYKMMPDGTQQEVNRGSKGDYFGELALLNDSPRAATVVAHGRLKCVTLGKKAFTRLLGPLMDMKKT